MNTHVKEVCKYQAKIRGGGGGGEFKANSILCAVLCEYTLGGGMLNIKQKYLQPEEGRIQSKQHIRCVLCEYALDGGMLNIKQKYFQPEEGKNAKQCIRCYSL